MKIIAIGGGKGGVGKSFVTSSLGMALTKAGHKTLLVDCDLGSANLHNFVGVSAPTNALYNVMRGDTGFEESIISTPYGVDILCGSVDMLGMAHITRHERKHLLNSIQSSKYDYALMDLGAGNSFHMVDFFNEAHIKVMVMTSEPTSIENTYGFLKVALYRAIERGFAETNSYAEMCKILRNASHTFADIRSIRSFIYSIDVNDLTKLDNIINNFQVSVLINVVHSKSDLTLLSGFKQIIFNYLGIHIDFIGFVPYDKVVVDAIKGQQSVYGDSLHENIIGCFDSISGKLAARL